MADATPVYGLRYQELGDSPDGPSLGEDLATDVEAELVRIDANVAAINGLSTTVVNNTTTEGPETSTSFVPGTSVCGIAFVAPPSGAVLVHLKAYFAQNIDDRVALVSTEIRTGATIGSGTVVGATGTTDALVIGRAVNPGSEATLNASTPRLVTGLTPGSSYNVRTMHATTAGGSITVFGRSLIIQPML